MPREVPPVVSAGVERDPHRLWIASAWGTGVGCVIVAAVWWGVGYAALFPAGLDIGTRAALIGVIASLLLGACGVHLAVMAAWMWGGWRRTAKLWIDFWVPATLGLAVLDVHVFAATGRHAGFYLLLALQADAGRWVGGSPWGQVAMGLPLVGTLVVATVAARLVLAGARWMDRRWRLPGTPGWVAVGGVLMCGAMWGGPWWMGDDARVRPARVLADAVPVDPWLGYRPGSEEMWERRLERRLQAVVDEALHHPPSTMNVPYNMDRPARDVVLLVLESWRADALTQETMPRLWALARGGLRFTRHYSSANSSYLGLFSLLHARPPLLHRRVAASTAPPAPHPAADASTVWVSCGDHTGYEGMDALLHATFDRIEVTPTDDWNAGDRGTLDRITAMLNAPNRRSPPIAMGGLRDRTTVFAVGFLMSTHFAYFSPPHQRTHVPEAGNVTLLWPWMDHAPLRNRYRNAAGFLDAEIAHFLAKVDLSRTLVVITGDHGQSLYDDGVIGHWSRLSDAQTRVPLVMLGRGVTPGVHQGVTTHADVLRLIEDPPTLDSSGSTARPILVMQSRIADDSDDIAIVRGKQRLGLRLHRRHAHPPRVEVLGLLDPAGRVNITVHDLTPAESQAWFDGTRRALAP